MKKLLALAVAAGLSATASADATLYGIMKASIASTDGATASTGTVFGDAGSRIGVKGSVDLSNGMKATYLAEAGVNFVDSSSDKVTGNVNDNGTPADATDDYVDSVSSTQGLIGGARHAWVGLKGGFGEVRVGRQYTPSKVVTGKVEMFGDQYGDYNSVMSLGGEITADNSIAYINKFGNVGVALAYAAEDDKDATLTDAATSGMINYSANGIYAGVALASMPTYDNTRVALAYKFPAGHKVGLALSDTDNDTGNDPSAYVLSGGYKMGNTMLKAQYGAIDNGTANDPTLFAIGADYKLAKNVKVYIEHVEGSDDLAINGEKVGSTDAGDSSATAIGMNLKF